MRDNLLKQKIKNGESAIGTFVKMTDPSVVEVLALAGFDFFVLDTEHVAIDREQLLGILRAAEAFNITPLVRVRENQQVEILQNLDLGYMGVQVPNVDTPEQAKRMVESVKYTPLGVRGLSPSVRACGYSTCGVQEYIDHANAHTMVVSHCETKECVDNLDEILKIDGIDVKIDATNADPADLFTVEESGPYKHEGGNTVIQLDADYEIVVVDNSNKKEEY